MVEHDEPDGLLLPPKLDYRRVTVELVGVQHYLHLVAPPEVFLQGGLRRVVTDFADVDVFGALVQVVLDELVELALTEPLGEPLDVDERLELAAVPTHLDFLAILAVLVYEEKALGARLQSGQEALHLALLLPLPQNLNLIAVYYLAV